MINVGLIPKSDKVEIKYFDNGGTNDIIKIVLKGVNSPVKQGFDKFSEQFEKNKTGLRNLWSFVKYEIVYKVDPDGQQDILLPSALWERGYGDCKSKTVFICHVLKCLKIPFKIRFTSYTKGDLAHVYPVAILNNEEIIIDSVFDFFDREKTYIKKKDFDMTKISMISGIGNMKGKLPNKQLNEEAIAKEYVDTVLYKRSLVRPVSELIPLKSTIADANAKILRRNLELQEYFAFDNPVKKRDIQKAINTLDFAIKNNINKTKVSGIGSVGSVESSVINIINNYLKDVRPATDFTNTSSFKELAAKKSYKKIGGDFQYDNITFYDPLRQAYISSLQTNTAVRLSEKDYVYGANSRHRVNYKNAARSMMKYMRDNPTKFKFVVQNKNKDKFCELGTLSDLMLANPNFSQGYNYIVTNPSSSLYRNLMTYNIGVLETNFQDVYGAGGKSWKLQADNGFVSWYNSNPNNISTQNRIKNTIGVASYSNSGVYNSTDLENAVTRMAQSVEPFWDGDMVYNFLMFFSYAREFDNRTQGWIQLKFNTPQDKSAFELFVEQDCGVFQNWVNTQVMEEPNALGVGLTYDFINGVPGYTISDFPVDVRTKKIFQSGYIDSLQNLTGINRGVLQNMSRNTYLSNMATNPEMDMLRLINAYRQSGQAINGYNNNSRIGVIDPATITAIIAGVVALISSLTTIIIDASRESKQEANDIDQTKALTFPDLNNNGIPDIAEDFPLSPDPTTGGGNTGGGGTGGGSTSGTDNTALILGGAAALLGGYFLLNKKKRS